MKEITLPFEGAKIENHIKHKNKPNYKNIQAISMLRNEESYITGHEFLERLEEQKVDLLNGDDLDYLLKNQELIPNDLKGKYLYAFGSIFSWCEADFYVRSAFIRKGVWVLDFYGLDRGFREYSLALSFAKTENLNSDSLNLKTIDA